MGVAGFFNWIKNRYPSIVRNAGKGVMPTFDCFFIDFNCIIHSAMKQIEGAEDENNQELLSAVFRYLDTIIRVIAPTKLIYIAVDGPAPFAKCIEQRSRRFKASSDKGSSEGFSKNEITVGSEFMERLHQEMLAFINDRIKNDPCWAKPSVIYDSYHTPGEGEHKLVNFIRKQRAQNNWNEDYASCVFSPDADIFFIILNTQIKKMAILREETAGPHERTPLSKQSIDVPFKFFADNFVFIYISILRELMIVDLANNDKELLNRVISDFCALGFFLGNDYIPHFPSFNMDAGDFNIALSVYCTKFIPERKFIIENNNFNFMNLADYLYDLSIQIDKIKYHRPEKQDPQALFDTIVEYHKKHIIKQYPNISREDLEIKIKEMTYAVLDSFVWVENLYTKGCISWTWCYPYNIAPSLALISKYMDGYEPKFELGQPPQTFACLVSVLPAKSCRILPACLQSLADPSSPIGHVMNGDSKSLSTEDFVKIMEIVKEAEPNYTQEERIRNTVSNPLLISSSGISEFNISSKFIFNATPVNSIFPSFESLPLDITIANRPQIQAESRLLIRATHKDANSLNIKDFRDLKGKVVLVDYPFFTPALVNKVQKPPKDAKHRTTSSLSFTKYPQISVAAQPLEYANFNHTLLSWGKEEWYPLIYTAPMSLFDNFMDQIHEPVKTDLKENMTAFIAKGKFAPSLCSVKSISGNQISVQLIKRSFNKDMMSVIHNDSNWIQLEVFSKRMNLNEQTLRIIMKTVTTPKYGRNIGMKVLKGKDLGAEGYIKKVDGKIFITHSLAEAIQQYVEFLGVAIINLLKSSKNSDDFTDKYQNFLDEKGDDAAEYNRSLADFVSEISPGYRSVMKPLKQFSVSESTYQSMEAAIEQYEKDDELGEIVNVNINNLVWEGRNIESSLSVGQHVCVITRLGTIPFGTSGTVITALSNNKYLQIISDKPLKYGSTMKNILKKPRVCYIQNGDLIRF